MKGITEAAPVKYVVFDDGYKHSLDDLLVLLGKIEDDPTEEFKIPSEALRSHMLKANAVVEGPSGGCRWGEGFLAFAREIDAIYLED